MNLYNPYKFKMIGGGDPSLADQLAIEQQIDLANQFAIEQQIDLANQLAIEQQIDLANQQAAQQADVQRQPIVELQEGIARLYNNLVPQFYRGANATLARLYRLVPAQIARCVGNQCNRRAAARAAIEEADAATMIQAAIRRQQGQRVAGQYRADRAEAQAAAQAVAETARFRTAMDSQRHEYRESLLKDLINFAKMTKNWPVYPAMTKELLMRLQASLVRADQLFQNEAPIGDAEARRTWVNLIDEELKKAELLAQDIEGHRERAEPTIQAAIEAAEAEREEEERRQAAEAQRQAAEAQRRAAEEATEYEREMRKRREAGAIRAAEAAAASR